MTEHTPGPWTYNDRHIVAENGDNVATWAGYTTTCCEANAQLIATAPDLLAACELAFSWWQLHGGARWTWVDAVQAAIARVKGAARRIR